MTPTIAGDEIDLTVPGPGANASGTFALWMSVASGDVLACSIASCTYGMTWRDDHDLSTSR